MDDYFGLPAWITAGIVFLGAWIYAIANYGFLFGVGLGWLPSAIIAGVALVLWPVLWLGAVAVVFLLLS